MAGIKVPKSVVDGKRQAFPNGNFVGVINSPKPRWIKDKATQVDVRYVMDVPMKEIIPADEHSPAVGARSYTPSISVVITDKKTKKQHSLVDLTEINDDTPYGLQLAASTLTQLALALNAAESDTEGNATVDFDLFLEELEQGAFNGQEVGFEVISRGYKVDSKTEKGPDGKPLKEDRTSTELGRFFSAATEEDEAPAPVAAAPVKASTLRRGR